LILHGFMLQIIYTTVFRVKRLSKLTLRVQLFNHLTRKTVVILPRRKLANCLLSNRHASESTKQQKYCKYNLVGFYKEKQIYITKGEMNSEIHKINIICLV
jgi:hypothetical protein